MKLSGKTRKLPLLLSLVMALVVAPATPSAMAKESAVDDLLRGAFYELPEERIAILSDQQMEQTRGKLWMFVLAVTGVDLALAGFFWGVYLPSTNAGQSCVACDQPLADSH